MRCGRERRSGLHCLAIDVGFDLIQSHRFASTKRDRRLGAPILLVLTIAASGCSPVASQSAATYVDNLAPSTVLLPIPDSYNGLAFLDEDGLVTLAGGEADPASARTLLVNRAGETHELSVQRLQPCDFRAVFAPQPLGKTSFVMAEECVFPDTATSVYSVLIVDASTGAARRVTTVPGLGPHVALSPDGSTGFVAFGARICEGMGRIVDGVIEPIDLEIKTPHGSFNLADHVRDPNADCTATGRADLPALSKDGTRLAFFTSVRSVGHDGTDRLDVPWEIMVWDQHSAPSLVFDGVISARSLAWSPDGRWLAFGGTVGGRPATWLLDVNTGQLERIADAMADYVAWSPSGSTLAIIPDDPSVAFPPQTTVDLLDMSAFAAP